MLVHLNLKPTTKQLRQFGWIALVAFGLLGSVIVWRGGLFGLDFGSTARGIAYGLWVAGFVSALFSAFRPQANRPLFLLLSIVAFPIGFAISHAVLAVIFYGILTPVGLLFRVIGRDPLARRWEPERESYWVDLESVVDNKDYFRQF